MLVTSGVFFSYLLGVVSFCIADLLNRAFHSMQKTRITMAVSLFVMTTNAAISYLISRFIGVNGLALGTVISSFMGTGDPVRTPSQASGAAGIDSRRSRWSLGKMLIWGLARRSAVAMAAEPR